MSLPSSFSAASSSSAWVRKVVKLPLNGGSKCNSSLQLEETVPVKTKYCVVLTPLGSGYIVTTRATGVIASARWRKVYGSFKAGEISFHFFPRADGCEAKQLAEMNGDEQVPILRASCGTVAK